MSSAPPSFEPTRSEVLACLLSGEETDVLELASRTGLSQSTVFRSVDQLLQVPALLDKRIARQGGRGRPTTKIALNRRYALLAGAVLGGAATRFVLTDVLGGVIGERSVRTPTGASAGELADWVIGAVRDLCDELGGGSPLGAMAIGLPGALTYDKDRVVGSLNLPSIVGAEFLTRVGERAEVPVRFENDSHLALLGELSYGHVEPAGAVALITMSTGVSTAISVDGEILVGGEGALGEFGRLPLPGSGRNVEDLLSEAGLTREFERRGVAIDSHEALLLAIGDDPEVREWVNTTFEHLLAIVALAFEPHTMMITGELSAAFDEAFLAAAQERIATSVLVRSHVCRTDHGDDSAVLGTISLASAALFAEFGIPERALAVLPPTSLRSRTDAAADQPEHSGDGDAQ